MLNLDINIDAIASQMKMEVEEAQGLIKASVGTLAAATNQQIAKLVQTKLHSRQQKYKQALTFKQVADNLWVIELDASALWIEEGKAAGSMLDDLLKSPKAKTSKDGTKYMVVPFEHSKPPSQQPAMAQSISDVLKDKLKKAGVGYKKLDRNPDGSVRQGLVHKGDYGGPQREATTRKDGSPLNEAWKSPALDGLRIYQHAMKNPDGSPKTDKKGNAMGRRDVMTFRVASEKHRGRKWEHEGLEGVKFFEQAFDWAMTTWQSEILPELLKASGSST